MTEEQFAEFVEAGSLVDTKFYAIMTPDNIASFLRAIGESPTEDKISAMFNKGKRKEVEKISNAFGILDMDDDGFIPAILFRDIMTKCGVTNEELEEMDEKLQHVHIIDCHGNMLMDIKKLSTIMMDELAFEDEDEGEKDDSSNPPNNVRRTAEVLSDANLNQFIGAFLCEGIENEDDLRLLSDEQMKEMGLTRIGDRNRLRSSLLTKEQPKAEIGDDTDNLELLISVFMRMASTWVDDTDYSSNTSSNTTKNGGGDHASNNNEAQQHHVKNNQFMDGVKRGAGGALGSTLMDILFSM